MIDGRSNAGGRQGGFNKMSKSQKSLKMSVNGQDPVDVSRLITILLSLFRRTQSCTHSKSHERCANSEKEQRNTERNRDTCQAKDSKSGSNLASP